MVCSIIDDRQTILPWVSRAMLEKVKSTSRSTDTNKWAPYIEMVVIGI